MFTTDYTYKGAHSLLLKLLPLDFPSYNARKATTRNAYFPCAFKLAYELKTII